MATLEIDLSGRGGLAPRFWGDIDRTTSEPQFRLATTSKPGQMSDGVWNPFRLYGYLAPANATMTAVTASSGSYANNWRTAIYDRDNDDFYLGDNGPYLWKGDSLDVLTISNVLDLGATGTPIILDTEIYQINGVRKMFVVYEADDALNVGISSLPYNNATDNPEWLSGGTLPYDGQTGNFAAGLKITGATSGATAWIVSDADGGATGTLTLRYIKGIFVDNEIITDSATGSATVNGTVTFTTTGGFGNALTGDAFIEVADNGFAYLFADNAVHKIDGTINGGSTGTVSANVLLFPPYFRITDAVDYRGLMFIGIHQYSAEARSTYGAVHTDTQKIGVYIWDRLSSVVNTRDYVPIQGCKGIRRIYVSPEGKVRVFAINSENVSVILEYNGSSFIPIVETGILGGPRWRDAVTTISGCTVWMAEYRGTSDNAPVGVIFAHGKITPFDNEALYKIGRIESFTSTGGGVLLFGGGNTDSPVDTFKVHKTGLYLAYFAGSAVVKEWDMYGTGADGTASTSTSDGIWTPVHTLPPMSTVHSIDIYTQFNVYSVDATIATVTVYLSNNPTAFASKTITFANSRSGHIRLEINQPYVNAVQLLINFAAAIDPTGFGFAPYLAVVNYEPTLTKG